VFFYLLSANKFGKFADKHLKKWSEKGRSPA